MIPKKSKMAKFSRQKSVQTHSFHRVVYILAQDFRLTHATYKMDEIIEIARNSGFKDKLTKCDGFKAPFSIVSKNAKLQ